MVWAVLKVHSESCVNMAQVVMVIQLSKGLVAQLRLAMEALEHVITWDTIRTKKSFGQHQKHSNSQYTQPFHHSCAYRLTLEKVRYTYLIFCSRIHLHAFAAVEQIIMVKIMGSWMIVVMVMMLSTMVTGFTRQKLSPKICLSLQSLKNKPPHLSGCGCNCACFALRC